MEHLAVNLAGTHASFTTEWNFELQLTELFHMTNGLSKLQFNPLY